MAESYRTRAGASGRHPTRRPAHGFRARRAVPGGTVGTTGGPPAGDKEATVSDPGATRRSLHAVAELVLAGPQFRRSGTVRLRPAPGGFATVAEPRLAVDGAHLVAGDRRIPLSGASLRDLGAAAGVDVGAAGIYHDGCGAAPDDRVDVDDAAARRLAGCYALGDAAMRRFAPDQTPVLWPEHFDLGIAVDEINYGVSPGDTWLDEPYAYAGPWQPRSGGFWNAAFGAARPLRELPDVDAVAAFFSAAREHAARDPLAPAG
jgi:hypothetical protein